MYNRTNPICMYMYREKERERERDSYVNLVDVSNLLGPMASTPVFTTQCPHMPTCCGL